MAAPTKAPAKRAATTPRKAARPKAAAVNGNGSGEHYEPPTDVGAVEEFKVEPHPVYGYKKIYSYQPKDGSALIEFPHISTCRPTPLFFYDNRNIDEMHQAFAWMDLCGIPDVIGRRLFQLPDAEQGTVLREWFAGLSLTPAQGVAPPGES